MHLQVDLHFVPLFMDWILKTQTMQLDAVLTYTGIFCRDQVERRANEQTLLFSTTTKVFEFNIN